MSDSNRSAAAQQQQQTSNGDHHNRPPNYGSLETTTINRDNSNNGQQPSDSKQQQQQQQLGSINSSGKLAAELEACKQQQLDKEASLVLRLAKRIPCLGIMFALCASLFLGSAGMLVKMTSSVHGIQVAVLR